jgi:hypothetical protein
MQMVLTITKKQ